MLLLGPSRHSRRSHKTLTLIRDLPLRHFGSQTDFEPVLQQCNTKVRLSKLELKSSATKPMVVMHGFLGSKVNLRTLCQHALISDLRKCFLVEMRNHAASDHHGEHNYEVLSDDIIRFADQQGLDKFTVLGHSMGGRTAMTVACRYPDRVDGVISVDAAPVNESGNHSFGSFTFHLLEYMHSMKALDENMTIEKAADCGRRFFKDKPQFAALIERSIKMKPNLSYSQQKDDPLEWAINLDTLRA